MSRFRLADVLWVLCVAAAMVWMLMPRHAPSMADETKMAEELKRLADRVEALERAVVRDPMAPQRPLTARLDAQETRLHALERVLAARPDARELLAMQREVEQLREHAVGPQRNLEQFERRLRQVEAERRQGDSAAEVRDVRREVQHLDRSVQSIETRLRQLESRQR